MRGKPVRFFDFHAGLNTNDAAYLVADGECRDCLNVQSTSRGSIKRRDGVNTHANAFSSSYPYHSLFGFETVVGSTPTFWMIGAADGVSTGSLYKISPTPSTAPVSIGSGFTNGANWEWAEIPPNVSSGAVTYAWGVNGVDTCQYWDGNSSTVTAWTAAPKGKYIVQWKNRLFIAGVSSAPSRLYASGLGDPLTWTAATTDFDAGDGEAITGLGTCGPYLLVFKETKIFVVYDFDTTAGASNRSLSGNIGACSHRSIVESQQGTFFLTHDKGVWITNGSTVTQVSQKTTPSFQMSPNLRSKACAVYYNDHYYLSLPSPSASTNDVLMDWDARLSSWWKHSLPSQQFTVWHKDANSVGEMFGTRSASRGSATGPGIDKFFVSGVTKDNDSYDFTSQWTGAWHSFGAPFLKKRLRRITFDGAGTFAAYISTDFQAGWQPYKTLSLSQTVGAAFGSGSAFGSGTDTFGASPSTGTAQAYSIGTDINAGKSGVGRTISVKFEGTSASGMEVDSYTMAITMRKN